MHQLRPLPALGPRFGLRLRPLPALGPRFGLRSLPRGSPRARPPSLHDAAGLRPLRAVYATGSWRLITVRSVPRAGGTTILARAKERQQQEALCQTESSARCPRCAYRSNARAPERHLVPLWPPQFSVIELANGADHGTYETEAEVAACLVFAGLRPDQVEIRSNAPLLALSPS